LRRDLSAFGRDCLQLILRAGNGTCCCRADASRASCEAIGAAQQVRSASVAELIEAVEPSVVQVETRSGFGSGFVLDESGLIVTCRHCIDTAFEATVVFADGRRAPVTGIVIDSAKADIAVLAIEPIGPLVPLPLATRAPKKGEPIVSFGSPGGLSFSTSEGSVSG
jgi:putative serine protease PepD